MWTEIAAQISRVTDRPFTIKSQRSVSGGCINQGYACSDGQHTYFVKLNQASQVRMFEAEAQGLRQIAVTKTIRVPHPLCWGVAGDSAYLVLEWLEMGRGSSESWQEMGRRLAALHSTMQPQTLGFGWQQNNTIGSTPQINSWTATWPEFFTQHRIEYQLQLARRQGGHFPQQDQLIAAIAELLADHHPQPALVHGDLWSGNAAITQTQEPIIFDPATYWGDREVDLAMTELFGGFPLEFYRGYDEVFPRESGYSRRKILYNLYHILNHFNLFGGGYQAQANRMIEQILA